MSGTLTTGEEAQLSQTIEMFEVITQSQPLDYQSLEILKEAYFKLGRQKDVVQTAKRIAQAYVHLGQLSSAILEYETILQHSPDDPDVQKALKEIENKATSLAAQPALPDAAQMPKAAPNQAHGKKTDARAQAEIDDGRQMMLKVFVEGKIISAGDFDLCWTTPDMSERPARVIEPFIQLLADKGILLSEKSLKILSDKSRLAYLPLDKYDVDLDFARKFPAEICRRWCILPIDRMSKSILVATANPFNRQAMKDFSEVANSRVLWYLAPPSELVVNLRKVFR
jgi:hypothetical protein